jgi:hypothetical protein
MNRVNTSKTIIIVLLTFLLIGNVYSTEGENIYPDSELPDMVPRLFAPGFISTDDHSERDITFSLDMKEMYFSRNAAIMVTKLTDGTWSEPKSASFSDGYMAFEGFVSPDGKRLYYISRRSLSGEGDPEAWQTWFVDAVDSDWGEPQRLNDLGDYYPTMTDAGIMYFTDKNRDLYKTKIIDGQMSERIKLSDVVNTKKDEYNSFIALDESYLIFTSTGHGDGFGGGDLFISFKDNDGIWTKPKNMGCGVNSSAHEYCPSVSRDGKYFFFVSNKRGRNDIYWVSTELIDRLKTAELNITDGIMKAIESGGLSDGIEAYNNYKIEMSEYCALEGDIFLGIGDRFLREGNIDRAVEALSYGGTICDNCNSFAHKIKLAVLKGDKKEIDRLTTKELEAISSEKLQRERELNILGYRLMGFELVDNSLEVFKINVEMFPESFNVYDSYGEALLVSGDTVEAITNYKKSLELNPENENAKKILQDLSPAKK